MKPECLRMLAALLALTLAGTSIAAESQRRIDPAPITPAKRAAIDWLDARSARFAAISDRIWEAAEPSLEETRSAALLADALDEAGFIVKRGISGMPTAFVAEFGQGKPIIGLLAEYDALPGLSQKAQAKREPLREGAGGHGCGHNLFGTASVAAALALRDVMRKQSIPGTIRLFGTPAEENYSGKSYMARDGWFNDLDIALHWHPGTETGVSLTSTQALNGVEITFAGKSAHASMNPAIGRSALDAVELLNIAMNFMREHVPATAQIHYVITNGGAAPNIVPDRASVWYMIRDRERSGVEELHTRLLDAAKGASLMTQTTHTVRILEAPYNLLINEAGSAIAYANLLAIGAPAFTADEQQFAKAIQRELGVEPAGLATKIDEMTASDTVSGTTDVGDVSWATPTIGFGVASAPIGSPWHDWSTVASSGTSVGHKALVVAAKTLASTALDFLQSPPMLARVREEWLQRTKGAPYKSALPADQKPPIPLATKS